MTADKTGSAWIAGIAIWAAVLAGFSIADAVGGDMVTPIPKAQAVEVATPQNSFDYDGGVHYWQEDRDQPIYVWPGQAAAM